MPNRHNAGGIRPSDLVIMSGKLLDSLLDAIVRLDADALVMHVGDKPYVVTTSAAPDEHRGPLTWGQVELSSRVLSSDAVLGMLGQLLPVEQRQALDEFGAIEHAVPAAGAGADRFTIIAARSGDDVWLEVRRKPLLPARPAADETPEDTAQSGESRPIDGDAATPVAEKPEPAPARAAAKPVLVIEEAEDERERRGEPAEEQEIFELSLDTIAAAPPTEPPPPRLEVVQDEKQSAPTDDEVDALLAATAATLLAASQTTASPVSDVPIDTVVLEAVNVPAEQPIEQPVSQPQTLAEREPEAALVEQTSPAAAGAGAPDRAPTVTALAEPAETPVPAGAEVGNAEVWRQTPSAAKSPEPPVAPPVTAVAEPARGSQIPYSGQSPAGAPAERREEPEAVEMAVAQAGDEDRPPERAPEEPRQAVVLPISRTPIRSDPPGEPPALMGAPLERVLRIAAARGASTVYVVAQARPVIRVDGEISVLDGEPMMSSAEVERLVMDLTPARGRDQSRGGGEWMADVPEVGRVRCVTFRDHRGPGAIFRMMPPAAISAEQLGLAPEVQALCAQPDGLVLVTGGRASGKSTLLSAFVDLINRTRSDHVITIETQIGFVHESRKSFVSQREVRGDAEAVAAAVRAAFREDPDVIVIEDLRTADVAAAALEAAESGRLVFVSMAASSTVAAIERLIETFPAEERAQAQTMLAGALRGVVSQVLLRKVRGGRVAAREVLLNTPAVASLILEGKLFQLPVALDSGRRHGMTPLSDALAALVREGVVHEAEAYRKAFDRDALLDVLKRQGIDTTFAERLA